MSSDPWEQIAETMENVADSLAAFAVELQRRVDLERSATDPRPTLALIEGGKDA